jgi:hypothetical protein
MAIRTALLVGSIEQLAAQSLSIDGFAATVVQGNYYLQHSTSTLSLLGRLVALALSEAGITITATLGRNLRVRLHRAAGNFAITWTSTTLRDLLGFTGNLSGQQTYVATNVSPLVWSPGWPVTRQVIDGVAGYDVEDEVTEVNADGTMVDTDYHNTQVWDEWAWDSVFHTRVRKATGAQGGTWQEFRRVVLRPNHRLQLYEEVIEDSTSTTAIAASDALATYKARQLPSGKQERKIAAANTRWNIGLEVIQQPEYS